MKKIVLILITLILAAGMVFATAPSSTVKITGIVAPTAPVIDDNPNIGGDDNGLWIHGYIVKNPGADPTGYDLDSNTSNIALNPTNADIAVDLMHNDETSGNVDSLQLVFGATSDVSATEGSTASVSVTVTNGGWILKNSKDSTAVDTLTLSTITDTTATKEATFETSTVEGAKMDWQLTGEGEEKSGVSVSANAGTRNITPKLIGWTNVTWGVAENMTPTAGDYEATITIEISSGQ